MAQATALVQLGQVETPEKPKAADFAFPSDLQVRFAAEDARDSDFALHGVLARVICKFLEEQGYFNELLPVAQSRVMSTIRGFFRHVVLSKGTVISHRTFPNSADFYAQIVEPQLTALEYAVRLTLEALENETASSNRIVQSQARIAELEKRLGNVEEEQAVFAQRIEEVTASAIMDSLTGLHNRRYLDARIQQIVSNDPDGQYVYMLIDLDNFKRVNDNIGHEAGDEAIRQLAGILTSKGIGYRFEDVVRLGGDEFVVLIPNGNDRGLQVAQEIRRRIALHNFHVRDNDGMKQVIHMTGSVGMVCCSGADFRDGTPCRLADRAQQLAKGKLFDPAGNLMDTVDANGKNRVWVFGRAQAEPRTAEEDA